METLRGEERTDRIEFQLNGRTVKLEVEGDRKLLWVLRTDLNFLGTKYACGQGFCGACTVPIDEEAQRSCQGPIREVAGKRVVTIESLAKGEKLHSLQKAFLGHNAFQFGFCTPGMTLNVRALLKKIPHPSEAEIFPNRTMPEPVSEDPDDDKFLACALISRCKVIVSGDRPLIEGIRISRDKGSKTMGVYYRFWAH